MAFHLSAYTEHELDWTALRDAVTGTPIECFPIRDEAYNVVGITIPTRTVNDEPDLWQTLTTMIDTLQRVFRCTVYDLYHGVPVEEDHLARLKAALYASAGRGKRVRATALRKKADTRSRSSAGCDDVRHRRREYHRANERPAGGQTMSAVKGELIPPLKSGDLIAQPLRDQKWVFGRVLLDMQEVFARLGLDPERSLLSFYKDSYLVQGFANLADGAEPALPQDFTPIFHATFMDNHGVESGQWLVVGNRPVGPREIDFPPYLANREGVIWCVRGEIGIATQLSSDRYWEINVLATVHSGSALKNYVLNYLGKHEWIHPLWRARSSLQTGDLRYREIEVPDARTAELVGGAYYDLAEAHGCPVSRLVP